MRVPSGFAGTLNLTLALTLARALFLLTLTLYILTIALQTLTVIRFSLDESDFTQRNIVSTIGGVQKIKCTKIRVVHTINIKTFKIPFSEFLKKTLKCVYFHRR